MNTTKTCALGTAVCLCLRKCLSTKLGGSTSVTFRTPPNIKSPPPHGTQSSKSHPRLPISHPTACQSYWHTGPHQNWTLLAGDLASSCASAFCLSQAIPKPQKMKSELLSHLAHRFLGFRADVHFHAIPTGRLAACFKKHLKACKSYWHTGPHQKQPGFFKPYWPYFDSGNWKEKKTKPKTRPLEAQTRPKEVQTHARDQVVSLNKQNQ